MNKIIAFVGMPGAGKTEAAKSRDFDQIENADQGGPIAMADYFVLNEGTKGSLYQQLERIFRG